MQVGDLVIFSKKYFMRPDISIGPVGVVLSVAPRTSGIVLLRVRWSNHLYRNFKKEWYAPSELQMVAAA